MKILNNKFGMKSDIKSYLLSTRAIILAK